MGEHPPSNRPYTSVWSDLREVEFSQGFVEAGPYRTRYLHAGDTSKPALLMLHGITGHAEAYTRNLRSHAEHFSCWAIDFIGHGYSSKPDHPLEITHYIAQVLAFMEPSESRRPTSPGSRSAAGSPHSSRSTTPTGSSASCSTPWAARWPTRR